MAISITTYPRLTAYSTASSPSYPVYSNWTASRPSGLIYGFSIQNETDINSIINIDIWEIGSETLLDSITTRPLKIGTFYVDLASYVRSYLYTSYAPDFGSEINAKDTGSSLRFYITWSIDYPDGTTSATFSEITRPMQILNAAVQWGNENGSNVLEYVVLPDEQDESDRALFLSVFDEPVMWDGYEFTLSFLYDNYLIGNEVARVQVERNANLSQLTSTTDNIDPSQVRAVNILKVDEPSESLTNYIDVYLTIGDAQNNYYVDQGYVDDGYTEIL